MTLTKVTRKDAKSFPVLAPPPTTTTMMQNNHNQNSNGIKTTTTTTTTKDGDECSRVVVDDNDNDTLQRDLERVRFDLMESRRLFEETKRVNQSSLSLLRRAYQKSSERYTKLWQETVRNKGRNIGLYMDIIIMGRESSSLSSQYVWTLQARVLQDLHLLLVSEQQHARAKQMKHTIHAMLDDTLNQHAFCNTTEGKALMQQISKTHHDLTVLAQQQQRQIQIQQMVLNKLQPPPTPPPVVVVAPVVVPQHQPESILYTTTTQQEQFYKNNKVDNAVGNALPNNNNNNNNDLVIDDEEDTFHFCNTDIDNPFQEEESWFAFGSNRSTRSVQDSASSSSSFLTSLLPPPPKTSTFSLASWAQPQQQQQQPRGSSKKNQWEPKEATTTTTKQQHQHPLVESRPWARR